MTTSLPHLTTDVCLAFPAISAVREGFNVQAVMNASGSPFDLSEKMARGRMENEGVILTATNTLMAELPQDWRRPEGGQLLGILFQRSVAENRLRLDVILSDKPIAMALDLAVI